VKILPYYSWAVLWGLTASLSAGAFGTVGGLLMAEGLAVRPLGLAQAFGALADDETSLQANPAGLSQLRGLAVGGGHVLGLLDDRLSYLDLAGPLRPGVGVGLQAAHFGSEDQARDGLGVVTGAIHNRQTLLGLGLGWSLGPRWRLGLGLKGLQEDYAGAGALSLAGDAGLQYGLPTGWKAALSVQNLGGQLGGINGAPALAAPLRIQAGVARGFVRGLWNVELDLQALPLENQGRLLLGNELNIHLTEVGGQASLRFGGQAALIQREDLRLSLGAGYRWPQGLALDYAWLGLGALGQTHRFSLSLQLGQSSHAVAAPSALSAPYGLNVVPQLDGLLLSWTDASEGAVGYNLYSDYGVIVERLNEKPVQGTVQKFVKVTRSRTYHFYVRPVGPDGKEGPPSEIKTVRVK
jgi:hypothetical protein